MCYIWHSNVLFLDKSDVSGCDVRSALLSTGVLIRIEPEIRCRKLTSLATYIITGTEQFYKDCKIFWLRYVTIFFFFLFRKSFCPTYFQRKVESSGGGGGGWPTGGGIRQALVRESGKESIWTLNLCPLGLDYRRTWSAQDNRITFSFQRNGGNGRCRDSEGTMSSEPWARTRVHLPI